MKLNNARILIFFTWLFFMAVYALGFLLLPVLFEDFYPEEYAYDGMARGLNMIIPVLVSFVSFWFLPTPTQSTAKNKRIDVWQPVVVISLTVVANVLVLIYFWASLYYRQPNSIENPGQGFYPIVNRGYNLLCLLNSLTLLPLGYFLGGVPVPNPKTSTQPKPPVQ